MKFLFVTCVTVALAVAQPRPEYPQPQFQREAWLSLNGAWEFEFDDRDTGLGEGWDGGARKLSRTIQVPFAFEAAKSGIGETGFHPVVWYRRTVEIPAGWRGRRVLLHFGAIDYFADVWVNGRHVAQHAGGGTPVRADITTALKSGPAVIVVRAEDPPTDRTIPRGKQYWELKSRGIFYTRTTGIWQPVWLEAAGESYLSRVRVTAGMDGQAKFDARIERLQPGLRFAADVAYQGQRVALLEVAASDHSPSVSFTAKDPKLWGIGTPNLYDVEYRLLRGDQVVDRVKSYFGFRTVAVENGKFFLNNRPVYLKMVLDQGYWPDSTLTPPSDEAIRYDIEMAVKMGFNGARKHQKVEDPRFHYWADRLGFLVSGETANAYLFDETYVARFTQEWAEAVERDYSHPSVVMWVPVNESWGVPNLRDPRQAQHLRAMYTLTKSLDATRPVIDNDGWEHADLTDLFGIHDYARTGEMLVSKYKDLGGAGSYVPRNGREANAPGFSYNGSPIFLSEFGGISYVAPGSNVPPDAWGYAGVEPDQASAFARMKGLWEGVAKLPRVMGICYTQLTDVEQEINGLMTYDRKPKFDVAEVKKINDLLRY